MLRLQKEVSAILPRLETPVLLVHSPSDTLAPIENVAVLQRGLAAAPSKRWCCLNAITS